MFQDTQNRVVAYPGDNGDFEVLNKAVLTFASGYENTAVQVDLEFDDTDPDAWGLTDARRVKEPVLRVRPKGSSFSYEYDFLAADSRTFHLTANDVGVQQEGVPYSTRWFTRFCAGSYGRMTVDYDLLPDRDAIAVQALANSVAFNGSDALAADLKTFNSSLQNRDEVTSYTGTLDARLPQFRFDGLRVGDAEGYTPAQGESDDDFLLPPWTGTASYHASQTLTMTPLQEGQVAAEIDRLRQEDSTSSRILSGTDSCLRYGGCTDEVFFRCSDEGQLELVFRTEWNTLVDTSRLPDGDRTPQMAALLSRVPGAPDEGTGPIFGLKLSTEQAVGGGMLDAATNGAKYLVDNVRSYAGTACAFTVPVVASPAADPTACAPVKADIASGSTVAPGQTVTLSCATSGAAIWYTTDGSCPCVESSPARRAYTGPIAVTENSYLIAYATADGLKDSATAPFIYFCAAPEQTVTGRVSADSHSVIETTGNCSGGLMTTVGGARSLWRCRRCCLFSCRLTNIRI